MSLQFVRFSPEYLPAVTEFSLTLWPERPNDPRYFEWRYLNNPSLELELALQGNTCVGMVAAYRKKYTIDGQICDVLETHDWFVLPDLAIPGVGALLMKQLMRQKLPIVAVGPSDDANALLDALGWLRWGEAQSFALPLSARAVSNELQRRSSLPRWLTFGVGIPIAAGFREGRWSRTTTEKRGSAAPINDAVQPMPDPPFEAWATECFPANHPFARGHFFHRGRPIGSALARWHTEHDETVGTLCDIRADLNNNADLRRVLDGGVRLLLAGGASRAVARATHPNLKNALLRARFLKGTTWPVWWWPGQRNGTLPSAPLHIQRFVADDPFLPCPSVWSTDAEANSR